MLRAARPVLLCLLLVVPAIVVRLSGPQPAAPVALLIYGGAVVAASFVLACAAGVRRRLVLRVSRGRAAGVRAVRRRQHDRLQPVAAGSRLVGRRPDLPLPCQPAVRQASQDADLAPS